MELQGTLRVRIRTNLPSFEVDVSYKGTAYDQAPVFLCLHRSAGLTKSVRSAALVSQQLLLEALLIAELLVNPSSIKASVEDMFIRSVISLRHSQSMENLTVYH